MDTGSKTRNRTTFEEERPEELVVESLNLCESCFYHTQSAGEAETMKLRLNKSQATKGMMSKNVVFSLGAKVDLTAEEQNYVSKYKVGQEVVYSKDRVNPELANYASGKGIVRNLSAMAMNINLTVNDLVGGRTIECKDITEMLQVEETVKSACQGLKNLLDACADFEGEEIIEY